jgi:hypothetical protein
MAGIVGAAKPQGDQAMPACLTKLSLQINAAALAHLRGAFSAWLKFARGAVAETESAILLFLLRFIIVPVAPFEVDRCSTFCCKTVN